MIPVELRPVADHLWQSTLFVAAVCLVQFALRKNGAALRHRLWLAASIKFLLPFSLLYALGSSLQWRMIPLQPLPEMSVAVGQFVQPFAASQSGISQIAAQAPPANNRLDVLLIVWFCGFFASITCWTRQSLTLSRTTRGGTVLNIASFPISVVSCSGRIEPGIFGVVKPVLLLPEGILDKLTAAEFRAILAHELCHIRRRDNLAASLHMLVESLFWFHPLVWWIRVQLIEERERACDEEVLRLGQDPQTYAESIVKICRLYVASPLTCASGITGADLRKRIRAIMIPRATAELTMFRKVLLTFGSFVLIIVPVLLGSGRVQAPEPETKSLQFEVVSIKPSQSKKEGGGGWCHGIDAHYNARITAGLPPLGRCRYVHASLIALLENAYYDDGLHPIPKITGRQSWMDADYFDVEAKAEDAATTTDAQLHQMLQNMLSDRFKLRMHDDIVEEQGFALVRSSNGPVLKAHLNDGTQRQSGSLSSRTDDGEHLWKATAITGEGIAEFVGSNLRQPVIDKTGLTGSYDFVMTWSPSAGERIGAVSAAADETLKGPSFVTALREQLGLRLEPQKVPVRILVIDHAEKPGE